MSAFKIQWPWKKKAKNEATPSRGKKRIYNRIKKVKQYHADLEMDKLGDAIDAAKDPERPNFEDLYSIYDQIRKDRHLKSQVKTAINDVQQSQFIVKVDGKEDEELKGLFDAEWFDDYIHYVADAEFWGHSLIEFPEVNENGEFDECFLIPRENVNPALTRILLDRDSEEYLPYEGKLEALNLIEIFGIEDLGDYEYLAEEVILKKYARTDWSQASEKYGMPLLKYATDTEDKKELDAIEEACANFAANGYIITGTDDSVEITQPAKGDFYKIYMEAIQVGNEEMSKSVNGQTATGDAQSYVGTAEMHERIKNVFTKARLRRAQHHVNRKLIPLMVKNNYKNADRLSRARIYYLALDEDTSALPTDPNQEPGDPNNPGGQQPTQASGKKKQLKPVAATSLLEKWLERFFNNLSKQTKVRVDPEMWRMNFGELVAAMGKAGIKFTDTYQYANLATELRKNAAAFAAFKNHAEQKELFSLLVDDKGEPRSWNDFKKVATPITEKYNQEWLKTERANAEAQSQNAIKWEQFRENEDIYPNVKYYAVIDGETTDICRDLDGKVFALNDPILARIAPQNHHNCRASLEQTDEPVSTDVPEVETEKGFDHNPGIDRKLFSDDSGYYSDLSKSDKSDIDKQAGDLLDDYLNQ